MSSRSKNGNWNSRQLQFVDSKSVLLEMQLLLGRKWKLVLVYQLLESGSTRFNQLKRETDGISSKVLSETLADLVDAGLVERTERLGTPTQVEYALSERGRALAPVIGAMLEWGQDHVEGSADRDYC